MLFTHDTELNLTFLQALADTVADASESGADGDAPVAASSGATTARRPSGMACRASDTARVTSCRPSPRASKIGSNGS